MVTPCAFRGCIHNNLAKAAACVPFRLHEKGEVIGHFLTSKEASNNTNSKNYLILGLRKELQHLHSAGQSHCCVLEFTFITDFVFRDE